MEPSEDKAANESFDWCSKELTGEDDKDHQGVSDPVSSEFIELQLIEEVDITSSSLPNDTSSYHAPIYTISRAGPMIGSTPKPGRESVSSCERPLPGPLSHLPGAVMDEHNERQIPLPTVHSTTLHDSSDNNHEDIPDLNNQYQEHLMLTNRVTRMLFIVTLVFFVTYVMASVLPLLSSRIARHFFRDFLLINHTINPVIYSIVNKGFRENCVKFVQEVRRKFCSE